LQEVLFLEFAELSKNLTSFLGLQPGKLGQDLGFAHKQNTILPQRTGQGHEGKTTTIWIGEISAKGYIGEDFRDTFRRYIAKAAAQEWMAQWREPDRAAYKGVWEGKSTRIRLPPIPVPKIRGRNPFVWFVYFVVTLILSARYLAKEWRQGN
jgi:hypothetical protein